MDLLDVDRSAGATAADMVMVWNFGKRGKYFYNDQKKKKKRYLASEKK